MDDLREKLPALWFRLAKDVMGETVQEKGKLVRMPAGTRVMLASERDNGTVRVVCLKKLAYRTVSREDLELDEDQGVSGTTERVARIYGLLMGFARVNNKTKTLIADVVVFLGVQVTTAYAEKQVDIPKLKLLITKLGRKGALRRDHVLLMHLLLDDVYLPVQATPWDMPEEELLAILTEDDQEGEEDEGEAQLAIRRLGNWIRSSRQLVYVSSDAAAALDKAGLTEREGSKNFCRWGALPAPGDPLYGTPIMIRLEELGRITGARGFIYVLVCPQRWYRVDVTLIGLIRSSNGTYSAYWSPLPPVGTWGVGTAAYMKETFRSQCLDSEAVVERQMGKWSESDIEEFIDEVALSFTEQVVRSINLLAALNTASTLVRKRQPKAKKKWKNKSPQRLSTESINLDPNGLMVWNTRWETSRLQSIEERHSQGRHASPVMHHRDGCGCYYWVRKESLEPKEHVFANKTIDTKKGPSVLYKVQRWRSGAVVGAKPFRPKSSRVRVGVADIDTRI